MPISLSESIKSSPRISEISSSPPDVQTVEQLKPLRKWGGKELAQDALGDCTLESICIQAKLKKIKEPIRKGGISFRKDPAVRGMLLEALETPRGKLPVSSADDSVVGVVGNCPTPANQ